MVTPSPDVTRPRQKQRVRVSTRGEILGPGRPANDFFERMVVTGGRQSMPAFDPLTGIFEWINDDEIIRTKGFQAYEQMLHDDQIKAALRMKTALVSSRRWDVVPASDSELDKEVAEFVTKALEDINLNRVARDACSAFVWGYALGEVVWTFKNYKGAPAIVIKKVAFRDPRRLYIHGDLHGNLARVRQEPDQGGFIDLPMGRLFHYAYQSEFGNPYGVSDLRSVYKNWWAKKFLIQFWNVFLERMGAPLLAVKYPQGAPSQLKETLKKILKGLSSKTEILIPEGVEFELIEATRAGQGNYDEALLYHDTAIGKGLLVPALLGMGTDIKRGSDSQSRLHLRTLFKITADIGDEILLAVSNQVVRKLVDFNFDVKEYPKLRWGDYGEFEAPELTDAIRLLHAAGILDMDGVDVNYARSLLGLPMRDEDDYDVVVRPPAPPPPGSANAPPPPAEQGNKRSGDPSLQRRSGGGTGAKGGKGNAGA